VEGTLIQYAGRLHRSRRDKSEVRIFDYVDRRVPMLARMFDKRLAGYRAMGYELTVDHGGAESPLRLEPVIEYEEDALPGSHDGDGLRC